MNDNPFFWIYQGQLMFLYPGFINALLVPYYWHQYFFN